MTASALKTEERKRTEDERRIDEIKNSFVREAVLEFRRKEEEKKYKERREEDKSRRQKDER